MKSLRMVGTPSGASAAAASCRCSSEPSKRVGSVSTETAAAPALAYARTRLRQSWAAPASTPCAGERSLSSAITSNPPASLSGGAAGT